MIPHLFTLSKNSLGQDILGGAFDVCEQLDYSLAKVIADAKERNATVSIPHYFACAVEKGWHPQEVFNKIEEAIVNPDTLHSVWQGCVDMFMTTSEKMDGNDVKGVAKNMRGVLEMNIKKIIVAEPAIKPAGGLIHG